jgi:hypothetical protein
MTTEHLEPVEQGGGMYYRCEGCGREAMRRWDLESEHYLEKCCR